jgi:squalene-hopene/tetraprenyl-beta-curcumene cyclase
MARALNTLGLDAITTPDGTRHDWRHELGNKMLSLQRVDGSWINELDPRWFEGNPVLATAYALLVLDECRKR